jgi:hypothetical protein
MAFDLKGALCAATKEVMDQCLEVDAKPPYGSSSSCNEKGLKRSGTRDRVVSSGTSR